ncbi:hypothetical protein WAF17_02980 [Bernardetia sp. ABR2-2B]|uniref:hypothetical protein n=1 Tax=Bernardetia sp. ABR2-2B TaxID=3127472 RepID=UPI0030D5A59C
MHVHKINPNSEEHQNFLAQNRKDPITGDSILEGDEVVFCAGCKSVFLRETWEYLRNRHCEQSGTLVDFPLKQTIQVKVDNKILFYKSLGTNGENQLNIPNKVKQIPWIYKESFLSPYDKFQESNIYTSLFILFFGIISLGMSFYTNNFFYCGLVLVMLFLLLIVGAIHDSYYIKKVNQMYKKFSNNTFYISKKSIGFATKYGKKHYTLPIEYIEKVVFRHIDTRVKNKYFIFYYNTKGIDKLEHITCYLSDETFEDPYLLFDALQVLSKNKNIEVEIESIERSTIIHLETLNKKWETNFVITHQPEKSSFFDNLFS